MSSWFKDRINRPTLKRVSADWFEPYKDVIGIITDQENTIWANRFLFGCAAGPSADMTNLYHEMAHLIEIDDRRCHHPSWNFKLGKRFYASGRYSHFYYERYTTRAEEREIRVFGMQMVIRQHYRPKTPRGNWMEASYFESVVRLMQNGFMLKRDETIAKLLAEAQKHTYESLRTEWDRKCLLLRKKQRKGVWNRYETLPRVNPPQVYI